MTERRFSPRCGNCKQRAMALATVPYDLQFDHDGRKYPVHIPALTLPKCGNCGGMVIDDEADRVIEAAIRKEAKLLTPEEIRDGRMATGYRTRQDFARALGVPEATVSRWEDGMQFQPRFHNDVMRAFFHVPELRQYLEELHGAKLVG